tara:strand:+ start:680 stop:1552 length:873 start_codon:yes stop_codon:yes gene_type:complete
MYEMDVSNNNPEEITIGKYTLLKPLGNGKFGKVFLVQEKEPIYTVQEYYALKVEERDTEYASLQHEITMLHHLLKRDITHIPRLYWYGTEDNWRFAATTLFTGGTLSNALDWDIIVQWFQQSCEILQQVHKAGVVHRDIKPVHFIRDETGDWNLIDFGLSTYYVCGKDKMYIPKESKTNIIGTPKYISLYVQNGTTPSRRDDFISLIYIFLNLYLQKFHTVQLPWMDLYPEDNNSEVSLSEVRHPYNETLVYRKSWIPLYKWLSQYPIETPILNMIKSCAKWNYESEPIF